MVSEEAVLDALRPIIDPDFGKNTRCPVKVTFVSPMRFAGSTATSFMFVPRPTTMTRRSFTFAWRTPSRSTSKRR